jgi:hypothetical protein
MSVDHRKARTEAHPLFDVPRHLRDLETEPSREEPRVVAEAFLRSVAGELGLGPDLAGIRFDKVSPTILGSHVFFQRVHRGRPITGSWVRVDVDHEGRVFNAWNDLVPEPVLEAAPAASLEPEITADEAVRRVLEAVGASRARHELHGTEQVVFMSGPVPTPAWKVIVATEEPGAEWKAYVDSRTGAVLDRVDLRKHVDGRGRVFDPSPVVTLGDPGLKNTSPIPASAYKHVTLRDLAGTGYLDGPFVTTGRTRERVKRHDHVFDFSRGEPGFKEVMVYFHIDRSRRYIHELGFTNILVHPIEINVDGGHADNSQYSALTRSLTFGVGGVDDAEDAEVILHEFGHAIQNDQVLHFGTKGEAAAMAEGFSDYWAVSAFNEVKPEAMRLTFANWDATAYSGAHPPYCRRLDSKKRYPQSVRGEVHQDGEIWSACLWEIRTALGRRAADRLILSHHFLIARDARFGEAAEAMITADKQLDGGRNHALILDVFTRRGILPTSGAPRAPDQDRAPHGGRILRKEIDHGDYGTPCKRKRPPEPRVHRPRPEKKAAGRDTVRKLVAEVSQQHIQRWIAELAAFPTRHTLSPHNVEAAGWLQAEFEKTRFGEVSLHPFTCKGVQRHSVVCTRTGARRPDEVVIVCAHFDSRTADLADHETRAPGADDNGSGVAALLEIARVLAGEPLGRTLQLIAFSGEEQGLLGSTAYAKKTANSGTDVALVINMDMIGHALKPGSPAIIVEHDTGNATRSNDAASRAFAEQAVAAVHAYTGVEVHTGPIYSSDYMPFEKEGYACIGFFDGADSADFYHTSNDTIHTVDLPFTTEVIRGVLATILGVV